MCNRCVTSGILLSLYNGIVRTWGVPLQPRGSWTVTEYIAHRSGLSPLVYILQSLSKWQTNADIFSMNVHHSVFNTYKTVTSSLSMYEARLQHHCLCMDGSSRTINPVCVQSHRAQASKELGKTPSWVQALLQDSAVREPRHTLPWMASWKTNAEVQMLVEANSKPHDIVIYTDGSVTKDRSGWGFTVKQGGRTVHEDSGAHRVMTSSLTMEVEAVPHAIQWLASQRDAQITHAIILTDSMNLLQKVESGMGCPDWHTAMHSLRLQRLLWIYCPWHAGVSGNERADRLASTADITSGL